jgi:gluconolactonase
MPGDHVDRVTHCGYILRKGDDAMTIHRLGWVLLGWLLWASSAPAQVGAKLADICDDCRVEKFASCGAGKFLEGPNFDKAGVMWLVGLQSGEILKVSPAGECTVATKGVSFPGGTSFDKEGKLIVTSRTGLLSYDTATGAITTLRSFYGTQVFRGLNDVIVDKAGGIYFTEPNGSNLYCPNGRVLSPKRAATKSGA